MNKTLLTVFFFIFCTSIFAQAYITAGGARLGNDFGISIQQRVAKNVTIEGIYQGGILQSDFEANLLAEQHFPLLFRNFNFYAGAGLGSKWINTGQDINSFDQYYTVPIVLGLEITLGRFNLSADFMPQYVVHSDPPKRFYKTSDISLRYVIVKNNKKRKKNKRKKAREKERAKKQKEYEKRKKNGELNWFEKFKEKLKPKDQKDDST